jgi:hypothetical protein
MKIRECVRHTTPKFVELGFALYEGGDYYVGNLNGEEIQLGRKKGLDFIGVKPDSPQWAHEEYDEWVRTLENDYVEV